MVEHGTGPAKEGRIPPVLFDVYIRYKRDTRAIVAWLAHHDSAERNCKRKLSINELFALATIAQKKAIDMPDTIAFHFREAIAARTQLSKFFRKHRDQGKKDRETPDHEYFTARWVNASKP